MRCAHHFALRENPNGNQHPVATGIPTSHTAERRPSTARQPGTSPGVQASLSRSAAEVRRAARPRTASMSSVGVRPNSRLNSRLNCETLS